MPIVDQRKDIKPVLRTYDVVVEVNITGATSDSYRVQAENAERAREIAVDEARDSIDHDDISFDYEATVEDIIEVMEPSENTLEDEESFLA